MPQPTTHVSFRHVLLLGEVRPPTKGPSPEDCVSVRALAGSSSQRTTGWGRGGQSSRRGGGGRRESSGAGGWGRPHTPARALATLTTADLL